MSLLERTNNLWSSLIMDYHWLHIRRNFYKFCQKYFVEELLLKKEVSLIFYNSHPSLLPRHYVPNAIDIGGIHVNHAQPLPKDIKKFIEEAPRGVILFTFGSAIRASSITVKKTQAFLAAFAAIPQRVLWKYEKPIEALPKNVMISDWLPQRDILEHRNVIAFMSHCGLSGVYEAIMTGTPMITIPLFFDQRSNAALLHYRGVGVDLNFKTASKNTILSSIDAVTNNASYYQRMQELSRAFRDRPMTPQKTVVYWTEYVLRHNGTQHLKALGTDMLLYKYLMLDIMVFVSLVLSLAIFTIRSVVRNIYVIFIKKPNHVNSVKKDE